VGKRFESANDTKALKFSNREFRSRDLIPGGQIVCFGRARNWVPINKEASFENVNLFLDQLKAIASAMSRWFQFRNLFYRFGLCSGTQSPAGFPSGKSPAFFPVVERTQCPNDI
jgi:hypothetical protein